MTIEIWGMKQSVSGTEIIDISVIALMLTGMLLCLSGAPKWLPKGIAVCAIAYFYYSCFIAYSDAKETFGGMGQLNDLNALLGGSTRDAMREAAPSVFSKVIEILSIGFWLILTSFISMKVFVFTPYTESTLWLPVKQKVADLVNKATEKATSK
ncbi:hypothetical protein BIT28_14080 [Photobacterium proteolyticum]|uniref:Uncharacterized protein n=1 Tax=Photobacterium proteolyticum TaxID=1903952 RepID=A0A1Q9GJB1_9GAMM|nr:hypothetical protein [Photobacterium proteolyticum]OLQ74537.1 hypothetical protein BIT28_14080 [Photobacterium proteolyticum]